MRTHLLIARTLLFVTTHGQIPAAAMEAAADCPAAAQVPSVTATWRGEEGRVASAAKEAVRRLPAMAKRDGQPLCR
jgi:hypothetical protein